MSLRLLEPAVHRGEVLLWATLAGHSDPQLPLEGMKCLQQALNQLHQWSGPTLDATVELARAGLLYGQLHLTLDACLSAPEGSAAASVAQDPRVRRLAMAAAAGLGRDELADRLAASLSDGATDQLAKVRTGRKTATDQERRGWLREDLADAIEAEDYMRVAQCSLELAELGVDSNGDIEVFVARSILPEETPRFISAVAAAHSKLDSAIPELRALARTNRQAGAVLVDLLQQAGRIEEAIGICEMILELRREPAALASRAQLLIRALHDDAENVAVATAAELDGFATVRRDLLTFAAQVAATRGEWDVAERRLQDALSAAGPGDADAVWRLVVAQLNTGHLDRASYTIAKHDPDVTSVEEAELWLQAHAATPLDAAGAAKALELAEKFNHPKISTGLLGLIITNTAGTADADESDEPDEERLGERRRLALTAVPAELHQRAFDILNRLVEEHGDATGVSVLRDDGQDPVTQLVDLLKASRTRDEVLAEYAIKAQQAQIPIGLLSALAGRGYATTLIQRALGLLTGASADDEEGESEIEAAASAINTGVVADASALLTASGDIDDLTAHFASVTLPAAALRDIHRAGADIRGAAGSPGSIRLDHEAGIPILTPLHPDEFVRQLRRSADLVKLAASLPSRPVTGCDALSELADEPRFSPWVDPIQLAHELGRPLWSDDLAVRRLARSVGVNAFGTPGLVTAINEKAAATATADGITEVVEKAAMRNRAMAADRIVDLHFGFGDIFRLAQSEAWEPAAGALALSRPSWWAWNEIRMDELIPLFTAVRAELPEAIDAWQISAMTGAAHAILDAAGRSRVLCTLALLGWDHIDPLAHLRDSMQRARAVAESLGHPDPAGELAAVAGLPTTDQDDEVDAEISRTILVLAEELGFPVDDA